MMYCFSTLSLLCLYLNTEASQNIFLLGEDYKSRISHVYIFFNHSIPFCISFAFTQNK